MAVSAPKRVRLFAFNVGFGDCFLLRFEYGAEDRRHVLIDFGSTRAPPAPHGVKTPIEQRVATKIEELCGGRLDVVVATHRHKDHISGFATKANGKGAGDIIAGLSPRLVLQPWTEDPRAPKDAGAAAKRADLQGMSAIAASVERYADKRRLEGGQPLKAVLSFLGEDNIANRSAIENLIAMGRSAQYGAKYVKAGDKVSLTRILPGVKLHVLGPPTPKQWDAIRSQARDVKGQYWLRRAATAARVAADGRTKPLFPKYVRAMPNSTNWIAARAREAEEESVHAIVRTLDKAMNNTSLILLFEASGRKLLFPGDAQWENWSYALSQPDIVKLLADVDLYKVGHHGSRNATPISLWDGFKTRGPRGKRGRLRSVMSTLEGVHGHTEETAVPRSTLTNALKRHSDYLTTENARDAYVECVLEL